jgi:acyl dehydratase
MADKEASIVRIHEIYIKATAAAIWEAITSPAWNGRYGYHAHAEFDLRPGGKYTAKANEGMQRLGLPDVIIDGEVIEANPPNKLVQTWRWLFDEKQKKEGFSTLTYEIVDTSPEVANRGGFSSPILHGMCSYGIACRALLATICDYAPGRIKTFDVRFSAPVYPGETVHTDIWVDSELVSFRSRVEARGIVSLDHGRCVIGT